MISKHKNKKNQYSFLRTNSQAPTDLTNVKTSNTFQVIEIRDLTDSAYVIRFERHSIDFIPGQHITLGLPGDRQIREYSIYSPSSKPWFEVLIKEVEEGLVSRKLHRVKPGDYLNFEGPFGFFTLNESDIPHRKFLFIATGTGIAPFHSITGSYPQLDYKILHGVRYTNEAYEKNFYPDSRYVLCTSRDPKGNFHGRVTDYLTYNEIESDTLVYLCGNCDMIYNVYDQLTSHGFNINQIKTEVYF